MKVTRSHPTSRFTVLPNDALEDERLSFKARGLLAYLLSRPDGWSTDSSELATHGPDGRTAVLSALKELEEAGYLRRTRGRDEQGHFFTQCEITDTPTGVGKPDSRQPDSYTKNGTQELKNGSYAAACEDAGNEAGSLDDEIPERLDALFTADFERGYVETARPRPLTETQRSKRITDAYAKAEPLCRWPAINGIVLKFIRSGEFSDAEIRDGLLRLAAEGRPVTVDVLRVELRGLPPPRVSLRPVPARGEWIGG